MSANNLIKNSQHGFLKDRSCVTNLLEFLEEATTVVDGGQGFDIIYLDFVKAFDKVPIKRLLKKVKAHRISGQVMQWIENWLAGRRQRVVLNGKFSSWEEVLSGVPRGSVLGPLLFIIFINDMDEVVRQINILKKFADDTKLGKTVRVEKDREDLQDALDKMCTWADKWGMVFNVGKCSHAHGSPGPCLQLPMNGQVLEAVLWNQNRNRRNHNFLTSGTGTGIRTVTC
jgi:ribonuclease P/MRP protein subunit RPP40